MNIAEKLRSYKDKINNSKSFDPKLGEFIAIELFDFITKDNKICKKEFFRHFDYLKNLSEDKNFIKLQDDLFNIVVEILKMVTIKDINIAHKKLNYKYINHLKIKKGDLTLPELYQVLQNKNNYYRLGRYSGPCYSQGEISFSIPTIEIRQQYKLVENFFDALNPYLGGKITTQSKKIKESLQKFKDLFWKLDEKIYRVPRKLHIKQFEDFFIFCTETSRQQGYEYRYDFNEHNHFQEGTSKKLEEVKIITSIVVDDLIESVSQKSMGIVVDDNFEIKNQNLIEWVWNKSKDGGVLKITGYSAIKFTGQLGCEIIDFFYNHENRKSWKFGVEIKNGIDYKTSVENIRKTIVHIDKRVKKDTNMGIQFLIEWQTQGKNFNSPKSYRWAH